MLTKQEIINYLSTDDKELFTKADAIRKQYVGDEVHLRGLIEFSNICKRTCFYCGLRNENHNLTRYRLSEDEIIEFAKHGAKLGLKTVVLQSGEDSYFSIDKLCKIVKAIKKFEQ